ncbi:MAG: hypothetical protein EZS28_050827, partial [Streblomastix strix]
MLNVDNKLLDKPLKKHQKVAIHSMGAWSHATCSTYFMISCQPSQILKQKRKLHKIVPVDKALKDGLMSTMNKLIFRNPQSPKINRSHMRVVKALTMKGTFIDATELVKGEGNEMMHRDGIFELSLKLLWPLIR